LTFARSEIPQKPHGLAPLCEKFGVHLPSHHDALSDAHACAELMIKLAGVANVHNIGHLYPNFAYRASSGNASFGFVNNKLDKDREAFYSNLNDIKDFFKQDPETLDFMALPLTGKTVSAIRGFFDLTQNELATWVEALGGTFIDFDINNPSDIILQGNRVSPDAKIKREQTNAVIKLSKIAINEAKFAGIFIDSLNLN
jgi:hypothetical protein